MINAIIIDDERLARVELDHLLKNHPTIKVVALCADKEETIEALKKHQVDLMFLDINMPEKNGFELLEEIEETPDVIFVTAYDEFAVKAFEVNALDYLLKPVDPNRLEQTIEKYTIIKEKSDRIYKEGNLTLESQIFIKDGQKCWFVELKSIRYFESEGNYIRVYFENHKPLILKSLNKLEEKIDHKYFFRANRKHIINLKWIEKVEPWFNGGLQAVLKSGEKIEISRRQSTKFKDQLSI